MLNELEISLTVIIILKNLKSKADEIADLEDLCEDF